MGRQRNGASTVYLGKDGFWHGRVTVGIKDDGSPDRRHVMSKEKSKVVQRVKRLEKERATGSVQPLTSSWTVAQWLEHWLENIAAPFVRPNTLAGYRVAVHTHLIPGIGRHKLKSLRPEHLERLYVKMRSRLSKSGTPLKPATIHQAHRTVRTALNHAVRRGYLASNPALIAQAPQVTEEEVEPYSPEEVQKVLATAATQRNGARWALALALGLRQGEALGLKWEHIDFIRRTLTIRNNRLRPKYEHGCAKPCGRKHAGYCPDRRPIRPETDDTKSKAGRRTVGLPLQLVALLEQQRADQDKECERAGQLWQENGWVFADEVGRPLNPRTDWSRWKRLLDEAGVRDAKLHDARHAAATVLLLLGVSDRSMMRIMGWSNPAMPGRYAHMIDGIREEIAGKVGDLLWAAAESNVSEEADARQPGD